MDFSITVFRAIRITDNLNLYITETLVITWIIIAAFIALAIVVKVKSKKWKALEKPTGLQNVMEFLVASFENIFKNSAGDKIIYLAPWYFSLFAFLIVSNIIGITGFRPPTADWSMTFPLALSSLFLIQYAGIRHRPWNYIKSFFQPVFIFFPLNIMGELSKPIAMSFRLFGNILGGMILMSLLYGLAPFILTLGIPAVLHAYFDVAVGVLQAFIFLVLSITFAGLAAEDS